MDKLDGLSMDNEKYNTEQIKRLFPNVITEGKIDFDKLRLILGDELEERNEKYQFTWNGKSKAIKLAQSPSTATLRPVREDSVNWDTTENLYIEGDNLEVLKQLQKTYFGKIKMIYIDPPYNTGEDFVYKDDFKDSISNYKVQTQQTHKSNAETSGRYHTDWLNMMYPRLMLSKNLLTDDGVIFISIDDNELYNLKKMCDEIFGEYNFIGESIRKTKSITADKGTGFNNQHESLLMYGKSKEKVKILGPEKSFENYKNPDMDKNGPWVSADPSAKSGGPTTNFPIKNPFTNYIDFPPKGRYWAFSKTTLQKYIESKRIIFRREKTNGRGFTFKRYKKDLTEIRMPFNSLFAIDNKYMNQAATKEMISLMDDNYFDYPKPVDFIKKLIKSIPEKDFYVLDFFSGSATTAHATLEVNLEDHGARKFIMVQIPEKTFENKSVNSKGYSTICDIARDRILKVVSSIDSKLSYDGSSLHQLDLGFKTFKLDTTNFREWDSSLRVNEKTLFDQLELIKPERGHEDILYEVLLKYGVFNEKVITLIINDKLVYSVSEGYMIVNLNDEIVSDDIIKIIQLKSKVVILRESGISNDNDKINFEYSIKHQGTSEVIFI